MEDKKEQNPEQKKEEIKVSIGNAPDTGGVAKKIKNLQNQYLEVLSEIFNKNSKDCIKNAIDSMKNSNGPLGNDIHSIINIALDTLKSGIYKDLGIEDACCVSSATPPALDDIGTENGLVGGTIKFPISTGDGEEFEEKVNKIKKNSKKDSSKECKCKDGECKCDEEECECESCECNDKQNKKELKVVKESKQVDDDELNISHQESKMEESTRKMMSAQQRLSQIAENITKRSISDRRK